jgi:hypothetical protein
MLPIVTLTHIERTELIEPWNRAFRRALERVDLEFKEAADAMKQMDLGQLSRQLSGQETFDPRRLVLLAREHPEFFGYFLAYLADEVGGWGELMSHGLAACLVPWLMAGRARTARATLEAPRSREADRCVGDSWRASA